MTLSLHVGADSNDENKISVDIEAMNSKGLGIDGLRVDGATSKNADNAIDAISAAIQDVSTQRSAVGAVQNRLEHPISNLDNVVANTTSAESAIRDTGMAT
ncbi:MAG: flagellin, partial [Acetatifactor sp.]|nr:flagellin [Acetatifactor sp.]